MDCAIFLFVMIVKVAAVYGRFCMNNAFLWIFIKNVTLLLMIFSRRFGHTQKYGTNLVEMGPVSGTETKSGNVEMEQDFPSI